MVQGISIQDGFIINCNPATGALISKVAVTHNVDELIQNAHQAFSSWSSSTTATERIALLKEGLATLAAQSEKTAHMITQEMGKPLAEAVEEMECATEKDDYLSILQDALKPITYGSSTVVRQALGVVVILSPWNFPADEILLLTLPALASGNTVIVKPSEVAPETGKIVVESLAQHLPKGVLQLAQGDGAVGASLVQHPNVQMVCMTGSSATGKKILANAAPKMKRCVLELGGKDPMLVFGSADIEKAASDAVTYSLSNSGQVCCSIERIYVAESIYDQFCQLVANKYAPLYQVGNGMDETTKVGPLVSQFQKKHVDAHVQDAIDKGATLLYQSSVPPNAPASSSNFCPVSVLSNVRKGMRLYDEETFGPVVALTPFSGSAEDAIRLANEDSPYGLASAVYTQDEVLAQRVASQIQAGQVGINCYALEHMDVACPWVGHKESGYGYHSGRQGFENFSLPKSIIHIPKN